MSTFTTELLTPVEEKQRIQSLDILRGIAVLGILIMNIQSFGLMSSAYSNPMALGELDTVNWITWLVGHIFADQKFMSIFSMLFGAGVILFIDKALEKGKKAGALHYRRNFWLLVIGLIHAYFFWYGDILVHYALCAFWVYLWRNASVKRLLIWGAISVAFGSAFAIFNGFSIPFMPEASVNEIMASWKPGQELIDTEVGAYTSGFFQQIPYRAQTVVFFQTFLFLTLFTWRAGGMMMIGMALYKAGVMSAEKDKSFYRKLALWGFGIGITLILLGVYQNIAHDWAWDFSMFFGGQFNYWGSMGVALGYIALIMLWTQSQSGEKLKSRFAAVGRMAFTNYLTQTLICTFIFYGHGLGLYNTMERWHLLPIVLGVWILQLLWSPWWLQRYYFGPFEWAWRSLTYWKMQPLKR